MSITRFVTADGLPAFLAHLSKSARVQIGRAHV